MDRAQFSTIRSSQEQMQVKPGHLTKANPKGPGAPTPNILVTEVRSRPTWIHGKRKKAIPQSCVPRGVHTGSRLRNGSGVR